MTSRGGAYVRDYYGVPARRFMRITFDGKPGVITGFRGAYLLARVEGISGVAALHPTWRVTYHTEPKPCRIEGCERPGYRSGDLCNTHRSRLRTGFNLTDESRVISRRAVDALLKQIRAGDWTTECMEWPGARSPAGYGVTKRNGQNIASRVVWVEVFGPIADGLCVCHSCDNPPCVNPRHLFLGTKADNSADMVAKGRHKSLTGEANPRTKLTDAQVAEIRAAVASGETRKDVAARYGVNSAHVSRICSGYRRAAA